MPFWKAMLCILDYEADSKLLNYRTEHVSKCWLENKFMFLIFYQTIASNKYTCFSQIFIV